MAGTCKHGCDFLKFQKIAIFLLSQKKLLLVKKDYCIWLDTRCNLRLVSVERGGFRT